MEIEWEGMDWLHVPKNRNKKAFVNKEMKLLVQ